MDKDPNALILAKKSWGNYCLLRLKSPSIAGQAQPGQFLMVRVSSQPYPLLRRPFSIHASRKDEDALEIFFARQGIGTAMMAEKKVGQTLDLIGPLGKGFLKEPGDADSDPKAITGKAGSNLVAAESRKEALKESLVGEQVFLVGGGRGIAPLYFLAVELRRLGAVPIVFYGGKTKHDLPLAKKFKATKFDLLTSTDDGSVGFPGLVSALVEAELSRLAQLPLLEPPRPEAGGGSVEARNRSTGLTRRGQKRTGFPAYIFACGPDPMMAKIASLAASYGIPARFSLESIMGCGIGACWGCVRKVKRHGVVQWVKVCADGPVFDGSEIVWDLESDQR